MKFPVLLLLLLSLAFAGAGACLEHIVHDKDYAGGGGAGEKKDVSFDILYWTTVAFALVILVIIAAYLAGIATSDPKLIVFAKDELFHLFISAILVLAIEGIMFFSCTAISGFLDYSLGKALEAGAGTQCYHGSESTVSVAKCYINGLENSAAQMLRSTTKNSIKKEMDSALVVGLYNPWSGGVMTPWQAHLKTESMQLDVIGLTFLLPAIVSLTVQKSFIYFEIDFIKYLIPMALFFRVLPPTRGMGNLLIALAIALYVFVPAMYALNAAVDDAVFKSQVFKSQEFGCNNPGIAKLINDRVMGDCNSIYNFWAIARILPQAFFFPNLTIAITITFLSAVNKALKVLT